jgi:hypothetical protein
MVVLTKLTGARRSSSMLPVLRAVGLGPFAD